MPNIIFDNIDIIGSSDYKHDSGTNGNPSNGYSRIFPKSDNNWFIKGSNGQEYQLTTNDYTTAGLVYNSEFVNATNGINTFLNNLEINKTNLSGNYGDIQIHGGDNLFGTNALTFVDNILTVTGKGTSYTTQSFVTQNTLEETTFAINDDGSIKIKESTEPLISEVDYAIIKMDSDGRLKMIREDGQIFYLNIDTFLNQRDVEYIAPVNGDIPVYYSTSGNDYKIINQPTKDFDYIIYRYAVNISSDQQLNFNIPSEYKITSIIISEISGNDAGEIYIGSINGGNDVLYNTTINANDTIDCLISKSFFSLIDDTNLFISSTLWGDAIINIRIKLEKI